jgi:hypothetical protein
MPSMGQFYNSQRQLTRLGRLKVSIIIDVSMICLDASAFEVKWKEFVRSHITYPADSSLAVRVSRLHEVLQRPMATPSVFAITIRRSVWEVWCAAHSGRTCPRRKS